MASIDSGEPAKKEENAIVVDVAPFIAQGTLASSRRDGAPPTSDETDRIGLDERMRSYLRDYFLGFVPPHIRRKGLQMPPIESMGRKFISLLSFPYLPWVSFEWRKYGKHAPADIMGGLTVGIMLVPQGMAYAALSNLPPIYGLYASTIAGYVYTFFGTSGQLTLGPVALVSLFMSETFTSLGIPLTEKDKDPILNAEAQYHTFVRGQMAAVVSFGAAVLLCGMALFRVGSLMKFVSPSVLTGFVTGSAVYIFISQSKYIWGFKIPRDTVQINEYRYLITHIRTESNSTAMAMGLTSFFALWFLNTLRRSSRPHISRIRTRKPWLANFLAILLSSTTLLVIIVATAVSYYLIQNGMELEIIGKVPAGFNKFEYPALNNDFYGEGIPFGKVMICALPIALLTYLESVSVARKYALYNKYALDMTQELWALGFGCLFASFFKAYPPGGSFSRTALQHEVGVKTPLANVVTSLFVTMVLVAATSLLEFVPKAVLGAIICTCIMSLFDFHDMWRALWVAPVDFLVMIFTFLVTVLYNVERGLEYGIIASVVILLLQLSKLDMDSIGQLRVADDEVEMLVDPKAGTQFRPLDNYPSARQHPSIKVLRLRANLFFGNVSMFRDEFYASLVEVGSAIKVQSCFPTLSLFLSPFLRLSLILLTSYIGCNV
ncbi:sulfate transporter [Nannochloropsis gaditana]|uniref:Sulfate transporter n=1 Tax=Nannochloropsis gaditana TaxID=72520 RepID=W7TW02_9STRA|nr:sulfate transporter [Nannochloropsis gaditana]